MAGNASGFTDNELGINQDFLPGQSVRGLIRNEIAKNGLTDLFARNMNSSERRGAKLGEPDVVEPGHGYILRHTDPLIAQMAKDPYGHKVIDAKDCSRLKARRE